MILLIDNYDSFTYNLVQYFGALGQQVEVRRNDAITLEQIAALHPSHLVISPGPCSPNEAGISLAAIRHFAGKLPLLGVCLGHQAIAQAFGASVVRAPKVMHGKTSLIEHDGQGLFHDLPQPLRVTRYHSLLVDEASLPECLQVTARTIASNEESALIMGLRHRTLPVAGVQFHPESILSEQGMALLKNFVLQS
ncbi:anthranilate synthase component II [Pseudaeromonas sharmana]|uniref:Anthranilate synthase component II n=1 Tax=Pseudaeromonas sharmana TaxID=328412 RepID=A0ABV8CRE7_9GAMM